MTSFQGPTANFLYKQAIKTVMDSAPIQEGRGEPTREITFAKFELANPRNRLISMRDINPAFAWVEVLWIMAGGNSVKYLEFWNKRMWDYADKETGLLYGAYGHRLGCHWFWINDYMNTRFDEELADSLYTEPVDYDSDNQLYNAYGSLSTKPSTRQVVLQIWDKQQDLPGYFGDERAADIPCNIVSHLMVRRGKLHWLQVMRSNDAIWGWPYNIIQWTFLQEIVAGWLGLEPGPFNMVSDSFHVYKKHWDRMQPILDRYNTPIFPEFHSQSYGLPIAEWEKSFKAMIEMAYVLTVCGLGEEEDLVISMFNEGCDLKFMPLMGMLAAEATRIKAGKLEPEERGRTAAKALTIANRLMKGDLYWQGAYKRWLIAKEAGVVL